VGRGLWEGQWEHGNDGNEKVKEQKPEGCKRERRGHNSQDWAEKEGKRRCQLILCGEMFFRKTARALEGNCHLTGVGSDGRHTTFGQYKYTRGTTERKQGASEDLCSKFPALLLLLLGCTSSATSIAAVEAGLRGALHIGPRRPSDVDRLGAATVVRGDLILDLLAIGQTAEPLRVDVALVHKYIVAAIIRGDEAKTFLGVEPLARPGQLDGGQGWRGWCW